MLSMAHIACEVKDTPASPPCSRLAGSLGARSPAAAAWSLMFVPTTGPLSWLCPLSGMPPLLLCLANISLDFRSCLKHEGPPQLPGLDLTPSHSPGTPVFSFQSSLSCVFICGTTGLSASPRLQASQEHCDFPSVLCCVLSLARCWAHSGCPKLPAHLL